MVVRFSPNSKWWCWAQLLQHKTAIRRSSSTGDTKKEAHKGRLDGQSTQTSLPGTIKMDVMRLFISSVGILKSMWLYSKIDDGLLSFLCFCYAVEPCSLYMELWYDRRQTRIFKVQDCGVWRKSLTVEYKCNGKLYSIVDGSIHWKQCVHTVLQNSPLLSSQWAVYPT